MKNHIFRLIVLGFVLSASFVGSSAQTPAARNFAPLKVAVVYSEVFADQKLGITRFQSVRKTLDADFRQTREDLAKLKAQMDGIEKEIRDTARLADEKAIGDKAGQFERLKREFGFRSNEANIAFEKRYEQLAKPISDEVSKALAEFAKKNGIDVVIDASKNGGVYVFNNAADLTSQFVAYFNALGSKP